MDILIHMCACMYKRLWDLFGMLALLRILHAIMLLARGSRLFGTAHDGKSQVNEMFMFAEMLNVS